MIVIQAERWPLIYKCTMILIMMLSSYWSLYKSTVIIYNCGAIVILAKEELTVIKNTNTIDCIWTWVVWCWKLFAMSTKPQPLTAFLLYLHTFYFKKFMFAERNLNKIRSYKNHFCAAFVSTIHAFYGAINKQ